MIWATARKDLTPFPFYVTVAELMVMFVTFILLIVGGTGLKTALIVIVCPGVIVLEKL
ncbi:MAG: hypothetical protein Q8N09_12170 [Thermodesulfovibrionia bacterium]|nr:hypothetical protein [Thermodesulfovibrionia bacterium]